MSDYSEFIRFMAEPRSAKVKRWCAIFKGHAELALLPAGFVQQRAERIDQSTATGKRQAAIARFNAIDHQRECLIFLGSRHDCGAMGRAVRVHVAVGHDQQLGAQLGQRPGTFRKFDVVADQQADPQPVPLARGITITGTEHATVRSPEVRLAVAQGNAFRRDQQRGVVEAAVVVFGNADHHGQIACSGRLLDGLNGRAIECFGNLSHRLGRGKAHQMGFREDQQLSVRRTGSDRRQRTFEVVGGGVVPTRELGKFDLHGVSLVNLLDDCAELAECLPGHGV
jgi:hypothetical protein